MSGILVLYDRVGGLDFAAVRNRLAQIQPPGHPRKKLEFVTNGRVLFGRYHLNILRQPPLFTNKPTPPYFTSCGYLCAPDRPHLSTETYNSGFTQEVVSDIANTLRARPFSELGDLNGAFQCACYYPESSQVLVMSDRNGLLPHFYTLTPHYFACAPDLSLLLALIGVTPEVNRSAFRDYFLFGFLPTDQTLLQSIQLFPPGTVMDVETRRQRITRYWRPIFAEPDAKFDRATTEEELLVALENSLRHRGHLVSSVGLSLSGGIDSRLMAGIAVRVGLSLTTITYGFPGSPEFPIAQQVADQLHVPHRRLEEHENDIRQQLLPGIRHSGGMRNLVDFAGIAAIPTIGAEVETILNGYGGNELLGFLALDLLRFLVPRTRSYLATWLMEKLNPGWTPALRGEITRNFPDGNIPPVEQAKLWLKQYPSPDPITLVYYFFFEQKARRSNLLGVVADNMTVEPLAPFLDNSVMDVALRIPRRERLAARFYRRFFKTHFPKLARITYSRTGLPANANILRIAYSRGLRRQQHPGDPDTPWDSWLRGPWREFAVDILLSKRAKIHTIIDPIVVDAAVSGFLQGEVPVRPVALLLTSELFLQEYC